MKNILKKILLFALVFSLFAMLASCKLNLNFGNAGNGETDEDDDEKEPENENENDKDKDGEEGDEGGNEPDDNDNEGGSTAQTPKYPVVKVFLTDGTPMGSSIVVLKDASGNTVAMSSLSSGIAEFKDVALGDYKVELKITKDGDKYYYDEALAVLSADKSELTITVYSKLGSSQVDIYGPAFGEEAGGKAYQVSAGSYAISPKAGMTYYIFTPKKSGNYAISLVGSASATVGNFGLPNYVLETDISESDGKSFTVEISPLQGDLSEYTPVVIGINAEIKSDCVLEIKHIGDVADKPEYMPWSEILAKMPLTQFVVDEGKDFVALDIRNPNLKVVLDANGYYHLNTVDGPLVVVKVTVATDYIASFEEICQTSNFGWYHFENGKFIKKELFNSLIESYAAICDKTHGVCPLTEELAYAIRMNGEYHDWWDFSTENHIFGDDANKVAPAVAWLFACGIIE